MSDSSASNDHLQPGNDALHKKWMQEALLMAQEALKAGEVPVGCVFVRGDSIIARARNRTNELRNGTRHAELEAIDDMLDRKSVV